MGVKWSGDLDCSTVRVGLGQFDVSGKSETSMSACVAMSRFTGKFITSTNDNGKAVAKSTEALANSAAFGTLHQTSVMAAVVNEDTTSSDFSISYNLDALTLTAFNKGVKTKGTKNKGYSRVGLSYDLDGMIAKAGVADADGQSLMDFDVLFSF